MSNKGTIFDKRMLAVMSRNILILLITGALAYGFISPPEPLSSLEHDASFLQDQDTVIKDSLISDSVMYDTIKVALNDSLSLAKDTITMVEVKKDTNQIIYGTASYYHDMFIGRKTATGAIFHQTKMTCAHRTIPLKSWVIVTNLSNGKSVKLYVNDRMGKSRHEIDLTTTAAKKLGYIRQGWTKVKIEVLESK